MTSDAGVPVADPIVVRLYVARESPNSVLAKANLDDAIALLVRGAVSVELVDVLRDGERALRDGVLVTPTLIRTAPLPERRMIGNLRDRGGLLAALGIEPRGP